MGQRRMFSLKIINSARFLKMPVDSQNLYFHLGLHADDDGVVEAYPIMKTLGSNEDNLRVLVAKGMIKVLNEDLVSFITDWREHNLIRADRKIDSIYKNLLLQVVPEAELIEPKPRADTEQLAGGRPLDAISKDKLSKDKLSKEILIEDNGASAVDTEKANLKKQIDSLIDKFKEVNPSYKKFFSNKNQRSAIDRLVKQFGADYVGRLIEALPAIQGVPYAPTITTPLNLEDKLAALKAFYQKEKNKQEKDNMIISIKDLLNKKI